MIDTIDLAAGIAAAYVSHNHIAAADVPLLLTTLHGALCGLQDGPTIADAAAPAPATELPRPPPRSASRSVRTDS